MSGQLTITVTDSSDNPIPGAVASTFWSARDGEMEPYNPVSADEQGLLSLDRPEKDDVTYLILSADTRIGTRISISDSSGDMTVVLHPLTTVRMRLACRNPDVPLGWSMLYVVEPSSKKRIAQSSSTGLELSIQLPLGAHRFWTYGAIHEDSMPDCGNAYRDIEIDGSASEIDLGTISHEPIPLVSFYGKPPPPWTVTGARGVSPKVRASDFLGKWLFLEFWDHWCGPCTHRGLPELVSFYEEHTDKRDRFQIVAFHRDPMESFEKLDELLAPVIKDVWMGKPLPFPILIDATGETKAAYGLGGVPWLIVINPEGHIEPSMNLASVADKLR